MTFRQIVIEGISAGEDANLLSYVQTDGTFGRCLLAAFVFVKSSLAINAKSPAAPLHIAVLKGGPSSERPYLKSARAVAEALRNGGHKVTK